MFIKVIGGLILTSPMLVTMVKDLSTMAIFLLLGQGK